MQITLASKTTISWESLAKSIPANILDKGERTTKAWLNVLVDMHIGRTNMIYYSFFFIMDECALLTITSGTNLRIVVSSDVDSPAMGFISGTLEDWLVGVQWGCSSKMGLEVRQFFNAVHSFLEKEGIRFNYPREELRDGTFQWK